MSQVTSPHAPRDCPPVAMDSNKEAHPLAFVKPTIPPLEIPSAEVLDDSEDENLFPWEVEKSPSICFVYLMDSSYKQEAQLLLMVVWPLLVVLSLVKLVLGFLGAFRYLTAAAHPTGGSNVQAIVAELPVHRNIWVESVYWVSLLSFLFTQTAVAGSYMCLLKHHIIGPSLKHFKLHKAFDRGLLLHAVAAAAACFSLLKLFLGAFLGAIVTNARENPPVWPYYGHHQRHLQEQQRPLQHRQKSSKPPETPSSTKLSAAVSTIAAAGSATSPAGTREVLPSPLSPASPEIASVTAQTAPPEHGQLWQRGQKIATHRHLLQPEGGNRERHVEGQEALRTATMFLEWKNTPISPHASTTQAGIAALPAGPEEFTSPLYKPLLICCFCLDVPLLLLHTAAFLLLWRMAKKLPLQAVSATVVSHIQREQCHESPGVDFDRSRGYCGQKAGGPGGVSSGALVPLIHDHRPLGKAHRESSSLLHLRFGGTGAVVPPTEIGSLRIQDEPQLCPARERALHDIRAPPFPLPLSAVQENQQISASEA
ncbi:hypothetical protein cyc_06993 [Cyclospora cayetanensis]|uniref:Transmembrane protein n=1 Tax=Cyclospora cayetanensis TaxID=88456 RepID=A0A1D3D3X8_9EIME|nr:hypothetical protein cyc_06993 [Cyclospora cayetanensis]